MHCVFLCHLNCTIITPFLLTALYLTPWQFSPVASRQARSFIHYFIPFQTTQPFRIAKKITMFMLESEIAPRGQKNQSLFCHWQLLGESRAWDGSISLVLHPNRDGRAKDTTVVAVARKRDERLVFLPFLLLFSLQRAHSFFAHKMHEHSCRVQLGTGLSSNNVHLSTAYTYTIRVFAT